jgi:hypothetical protein
MRSVEMTLAIEPDRLVLPDEPGLAFGDSATACHPGLHVVLGRNNAGKTRLLRALAAAQFSARITPREHDRWRRFDNNMLANEWDKLPPLQVTWPRDRPSPESQAYPVSGVPPGIIVANASAQEVRAEKPGLDADFFRHVVGELWVYLRFRPAVVVPTDRYFRHATRLADGFHPDEPAGWAAELTRLANSANADDRGVWRSLKAAFDDITEGLKLEGRLSGEEVVIQVEDGDEERPLSHCGDGLRDLAAILLFATRWPSHDLMLDEPGLRLHPHAQRRLLFFLEAQTHDRAVWVASHDGVFVAASNAKRRFFVDRSGKPLVSTVRDLPTREDGRQALELLGWAPGDSFLADRILLGEGPSDRAAFSAAVGWMAEMEPSWGGTVVLDLGGQGVASARKPELRRRLELLKRVAPHAAAWVILDSDKKSKDQITATERWFNEHGFQVKFLSVPVLENYWLAPATVLAIVEAAGLEAASHGHEVELPSLDVVTTAIQEETKDDRVGSEILEALMTRFKLQFSKTAAAEAAIAVLAKVSPKDADALQKDVARIQ